MATSPERLPSYIKPGVSKFTELEDTPKSYTGQSGKALRVKTTEDGLEFGTAGVSKFTELSDVPSSYTGQAGKAVKVKTTEDGLEFKDIPLPGWKLIKSGNFSAGVDVTGLDGNTHKVYRLIIRGASGNKPELIFNGDTGNNYDYIVHGFGLSVGAAFHETINGSATSPIPLYDKSIAATNFIEMFIDAQTGLRRKVIGKSVCCYDQNNYQECDFFGMWRNTTDNLVSFRIYGISGEYWLFAPT
jgi:uncharacterized protein YcnI